MQLNSRSVEKTIHTNVASLHEVTRVQFQPVCMTAESKGSQLDYCANLPLTF